MNTKSSKRKVNEIQESFHALFFNTSEAEQMDLNARIMAAKFLAVIQSVADKRGLNRKELAEKVGTSASYLTQLFRGHKLPNFIILAKFQKALGIEFDVVDSCESNFKSDDIAEYLGKWFESKHDGTFLKIVKRAKVNLENIDYAHTKRHVG